jgi:hypothetical protein
LIKGSPRFGGFSRGRFAPFFTGAAPDGNWINPVRRGQTRLQGDLPAAQHEAIVPKVQGGSVSIPGATIAHWPNHRPQSARMCGRRRADAPARLSEVA